MDFLFNDNASDTSLLLMGLEKTTCERQILALCQQLPTKHYIKRYKLQVYKNNNCNLLQSSSSFSICASCGICSVFYTFFNVLGADHSCFSQFGGGSHCLNFDQLISWQ